MAFEFLISTENVLYVLTVVKDLFRDLNQIKLFFTSLEPFIVKNLIEKVPEVFLQEFV